jgi:adenylate kinase family enzyme
VQGIHITGASGSGVTTLGRALAARLGAAHLDTDGFYWLPTDPPFHERRALPDRLEMLEQAFAAADHGWVLSGSLDGWGNVFIPRFSIVLFVYTPHGIRMARIHAREIERYGDAVEPGGAMYEQHLEFLAWADGYDQGGQTGRSLPRHEAWLKTLPCPVLRLDGLLPVDVLVETAMSAVEGDAE